MNAAKIAGYQRAKAAARPKTFDYTAKSGPNINFAARAVEDTLRRDRFAVVDLEDREVERVYVEVKVRPVVELKGDRNPRTDVQRQQVSVMRPGREDVHLEVRTSQSGNECIDVEQHIVIDINRHVRAIDQLPHSESVEGNA